MSLDRRDVLKAAMGLGMAAAWRLPFAATVPAGKRLILLELKGGNDSLNTFPSLRDPLYRQLRPTLALPTSAILPISAERGLNWAMQSLLPLWEKGEFAIVDGLGSAKPDLSHFWAAQQWETGNPDDPKARTGWLAQALASNSVPASEASNAHAVVFGFNSGPLAGAGIKLLEIGDSSLGGDAVMPDAASGQLIPEAQRHLAQVLRDWQQSQQLMAKPAKLPKSDIEFPNSAFSHQLQQLAALMVQDPGLRVFKLVVDGFDTHSNQVDPASPDQGRHFKLLRRTSRSLAAFISILQKQGLWQDTVIASYSEFGRRVQENGSAGTDHGTAGSAFVLGGRVRGGLHGALPSLGDLNADGNLKLSVDFRRYYNSLSVAIGLPATPFDIARYPLLGLV